jgi:predicted dehydrogenase
MEKIPVCLIGCGGMGQRHILAYKELERSGIGNLELVAVCDLREDNAERGANEVERLFGTRPMVFTDLEKMLARDDIAAVDVVTDPSTHHSVAVPSLLAGKHAQVEKPLGITVRASQAIIDAAKKAGVVLATSENLRRDPPNRLARAIIDAGLLGDPHLMVHNSMGGNDQMIITPWRHLKEKGAIGLDMGVHLTDIVQYYMGDFEQIYGTGLIVEETRRRPDNHGLDLESYRERYKEFPESIKATGEDGVVASYLMKSGAMVQFTYIGGGRGSRSFERSVHGRDGTLYAPGDRNGNQVVLNLGGNELRGKDILSLLPDFSMTEITERLFGKNTVQYELTFPEVDAKHMAIEFHDFGESIRTGATPEVDGYRGMTAVAAILGAYESAACGRAVTMEEVMSGDVNSYQKEIDEALGFE